MQESPGDVGDAAQRVGEVCLATFSAELNLLFSLELQPSEIDGLQIEMVPIFCDLVLLPAHLLIRLCEVGLHQVKLGLNVLNKPFTVTAAGR